MAAHDDGTGSSGWEARGYAPLLVDELLDQIGELFYTEHLAIEQGIVGTAEHLALRRSRSGPKLERIFTSVEVDREQFDPRSSLGKALNYVMNQRGRLSLFMSDAGVPIHNNLSERVLRVVAQQRKNALFVGHDEAGVNLARLMSLVTTCRLHGVNPERWLADVLIGVSECTRAEDLLPWVWKEGRGKTARPVFDTA